MQAFRCLLLRLTPLKICNFDSKKRNIAIFWAMYDTQLRTTARKHARTHTNTRKTITISTVSRGTISQLRNVTSPFAVLFELNDHNYLIPSLLIPSQLLAPVCHWNTLRLMVFINTMLRLTSRSTPCQPNNDTDIAVRWQTNMNYMIQCHMPWWPLRVWAMNPFAWQIHGLWPVADNLVRRSLDANQKSVSCMRWKNRDVKKASIR